MQEGVGRSKEKEKERAFEATGGAGGKSRQVQARAQQVQSQRREAQLLQTAAQDVAAKFELLSETITGVGALQKHNTASLSLFHAHMHTCGASANGSR